MLSQTTALHHLTTYRSGYAPVFNQPKADDKKPSKTPVSVTLHAPENRHVADAAGMALVEACRSLALSLRRNHAHTVDDEEVESLLLDIVLIRSFVYDPTMDATFTTWLGRVLRNAMTDILRKQTQSRGLDDGYRTYAVSPIAEDDDRRSVLDADASDFMSSTSATGDSDVEAIIPGILDQVRDRAISRDLDGDLIVRVAVSYLLSRYDRVRGEEKLATRADIKSETGMSEWATRKATDAAEDILRRVLSNQPEDDRKTA